MGRRELLGPAQVNGIVDVTPAVELVAAHRPAQGELERIGALRIGDHTYSLARSSLSLSSEGGASNLQVKALGHLVLYVRNLERSRGFYRDVLGWKEITVSGEEIGFPAAAFSSGRTHHELLLIEVGEDATPIPRGRRVGMYHFGLKVGDTDEELREVLQALQDNGVRLMGTADHGMTHSLYLADPDGNEIELYVDVPGVDWDDPGVLAQPTRPLRI